MRYLAILPLLLLLAMTSGSGKPIDDRERAFEVPGGGRLFYERQEGEAGPEVVGISYSGPAEWLVAQEHPRSHWHKLPALERIEFVDTSVTSEQIEYVAQLESVTRVRFWTCDYEANALRPLGKMTWLKGLEIDFSSFRVNDFTDLKPQPEFCDFIGKLVNLQSLDLCVGESVPIGEETFRAITKLENLRELNIRLQELDAETLGLVSKLSQLEFFRFEGLENPLPLLEGLRGHRRLKTLFASRVDDRHLATLASLASLEMLSLDGKSIGSLAPLANLTNLRSLMMRFHAYKAEELGWMQELPQLEMISVWGSLGEDLSLEGLRGHEGLRKLWFYYVRLSVEDLEVLASMPNLEKLLVGNEPDSEWHVAAKRRLAGVEIYTRR
ncbi:MAG: hypothetical protein WD294_10615 [Phycisphaeraceae bacterium]